jgi:hypothetical protein
VQVRDSSVATPNFTLTENRAYAGNVNAVIPTRFLGVMGVNSINVSASATASVRSKGGYYCVLALNQTAQPGLQLTGNASISITAPKFLRNRRIGWLPQIRAQLNVLRHEN